MSTLALAETFACNYNFAEHYKILASQYDKFYEAKSQAKADFIKKHVAIARDDQVIDIGGGTAQISLMLKEDLELTKPVVCVDPSAEMLEVARKNGAITVQATAEGFLASEPLYPLKVVIFVCCVHHFEDPNTVFTNLAKHMPSDGVCFLLEYPPETTLPWFKAAEKAFSSIGNRLTEIQALAECKGFKCRVVTGMEPVEMEKSLWYEAIRKRSSSALRSFTDEELEEGIRELEEKFAGSNVLKYDIAHQGIIMTL